MTIYTAVQNKKALTEFGIFRFEIVLNLNILEKNENQRAKSQM